MGKDTIKKENRMRTCGIKRMYFVLLLFRTNELFVRSSLSFVNIIFRAPR